MAKQATTAKVPASVATRWCRNNSPSGTATGASFSRASAKSGVSPILSRTHSPNTTSTADKIGRASCRERVCQYVEISVDAVTLKKKTNKINKTTDDKKNKLE